jgi:hypothetical protein
MNETRHLTTSSPRPHLPPPNAEQLLSRAAELIATGWCQNALARDEHGRQVEPWGPNASRWSLLGALTRIWHDDRGEELEVFEAAYAALALATGGRPEEWNDARWRTKRHVLRAFLRAHDYLPGVWRHLDAG